MTFVLTSVLNSFSLSHAHTHTHTHTHTRSEAQARVGLDYYLWYILKRGDVYKRERDMLMPKVLLSLQIL